jgi:peptidyl-prolyl cis-trans isomerase SurA
MPRVEVQILSQNPEVSQAEIDRIKEELMDYAKRVNSGEASFATLARMYSQDESSARMGGEMDYSGRAQFVPEFSDVAFSLTDKNTVSKIVKTEYGYHIIQLIDRKGDKVKVRHILRRPTVSDEAITKSLSRLDSIANDIRNHKFTFNEAVVALSEDKETRNNNGLMVNKDYQRDIQTSRFEMKDLPADVAKVVNRMHVGEISDAFLMKNRNGQETCAIVLLKNRIDGHRADITADFQILSDIVQAKREESILENWIKDKQKSTYISIKEGWKKTDFRYPGWIK